MKHVFIGLVVWVLFGVADTWGHEFTLPDGRSLEAEIVDYNSKLGLVELKRPDGKRVKVKPSIFVEADQIFIEEWSALQAFTSDRFLKISCKEVEVDDRKEEDYQEVSIEGGSPERMLMKVTTFEKIAYEISLKNMNPATLDGLRIDYVIYYEQSLETYEKPEVKQETFRGDLVVPALLGRKTVQLVTTPVEIHTDNINSLNWSDGRSRTGGKGEVHGLRARIYMKTADGAEAMREFSEPESLSVDRHPWPADEN